jgi:hypothetical protein
VPSGEENGTAVTSVHTSSNLYRFTVSAPGCVAKSADTAVSQSDPLSVRTTEMEARNAYHNEEQRKQ